MVAGESFGFWVPAVLSGFAVAFIIWMGSVWFRVMFYPLSKDDIDLGIPNALLIIVWCFTFVSFAIGCIASVIAIKRASSSKGVIKHAIYLLLVVVYGINIVLCGVLCWKLWEADLNMKHMSLMSNIYKIARKKIFNLFIVTSIMGGSMLVGLCILGIVILHSHCSSTDKEAEAARLLRERPKGYPPPAQYYGPPPGSVNVRTPDGTFLNITPGYGAEANINIQSGGVSPAYSGYGTNISPNVQETYGSYPPIDRPPY